MKQRHARVLMLTCLTLTVSCLGCASVPPAAAPAPAPTSAAAGATTIVAVAPPAAPSVSLPQFLGLDVAFGGVQRLGSRLRNRLSTRFPILEPRPPVKSLTDPSNSGPDASPAVQAAAEAKAEEDQAPQKAKAIKFLASRGCGECYPDTEDALLAALDDCTEDIRYGVVRGLRGSCGATCKSCCENSCCSPKLLKRLYEIAYDRDETGCFVESSARVRRNARLVICGCGGVPDMGQSDAPTEGPSVLDGQPTPAGEVATAVQASDEGVVFDTGEAFANNDLFNQEANLAEIALLDVAVSTVDHQSTLSPASQPVKAAAMVEPQTSQAKPVTVASGFVLPDFMGSNQTFDDDSATRR